MQIPEAQSSEEPCKRQFAHKPDNAVARAAWGRGTGSPLAASRDSRGRLARTQHHQHLQDHRCRVQLAIAWQESSFHREVSLGPMGNCLDFLTHPLEQSWSALRPHPTLGNRQPRIEDTVSFGASGNIRAPWPTNGTTGGCITSNYQELRRRANYPICGLSRPSTAPSPS